MFALGPRFAGVAMVVVAVVGIAGEPASASVPDTFVTPMYEMTCNTSVLADASGNDQGVAKCSSTVPAQWAISVKCTYGGTYGSGRAYIQTYDGHAESQTLSAGECWFGVDDVKVIEFEL